MVFEAFSSGFYIVQHSSLDFLFTTFSLGYYHHKCMYYGTGVGAESNNNEKCCMGTVAIKMIHTISCFLQLFYGVFRLWI